MSHPGLNYPSEPPTYEGFGDYSYPDSSPDVSPTIDDRKYGFDIDDAYEKHFININQRRDMAENQYRIDNNRQNLEKSLDMDDNEITKRAVQINTNLTTINEEGGNGGDSPQE